MIKLDLKPEIFRAYDIRGIVGEGLTKEVMQSLGQAIGSEALDQGESTLILACDARLSSPEFHQAMQIGILSSGCNVIDIGVLPSPLLYFATHHLACSSGVMITGSHNPGQYNGVKIVLKQQCLADRQIQKIRTRIQDQELYSGTGELSQCEVLTAYIERIVSDIHLRRRLKIVVDAGNGVAGLVAPQLFEELGCEVIDLYCEPDGRFPNHHPDPTVKANLRDLIAQVIDNKADLGVAFDGDGDRLGLITSTGAVLDADKMLMCFISDIMPDNPGAKVVFDVKSSFHLSALVEANDGIPLMCKSGHSFVKRKMQESDAILGGEYSAHIFFKHRWYGFDDGLYTAARFLELMDKYNNSADNLLEKMPASVSTPELSIPVSEAKKFALMDRLSEQMKFSEGHINKLDGLRVDLPSGWGLIRASNTSPKLVLRFEATDQEALKHIQALFRQELARLAPDLDLEF